MRRGERWEALELGRVRYFTGRPCYYGHIAQRATNNGSCMECSRIRERKRLVEHGPAIYARRRELRRARKNGTKPR